MKTAAIGSLPHAHIDSALNWSFRLDIPTLPQLPIRYPSEFMIAQALEGLPGLQVGGDSLTQINADLWANGSHAFEGRLEAAFKDDVFTPFEPSAEGSHAWKGFLFECAERSIKAAKIQIAGPLTCTWAIKLTSGKAPASVPGLTEQIFKLVLARTLAMTRALKSRGIQPMVSIDEPALFALGTEAASTALEQVSLEPLKIIFQALGKEGAHRVLHCCSDSRWSAVLELPFERLSIDTHLSLPSLLTTHRDSLERFIARGGKLAFGVVPTRSLALDLPAVHFASELRSALKAARFESLLDDAWITPACGLAYQTIEEAERAPSLLRAIAETLSQP